MPWKIATCPSATPTYQRPSSHARSAATRRAATTRGDTDHGDRRDRAAARRRTSRRRRGSTGSRLGDRRRGPLAAPRRRTSSTSTVMLSMPPARFAAAHEPVRGVLRVRCSALAIAADLLLGDHVVRPSEQSRTPVAVEQRDVARSSTSTSGSVPSERSSTLRCGWTSASASLISPARDHAVHQRVVLGELPERAARGAGRRASRRRATRSSPSGRITAAVSVVPIPGTARSSPERANTARFASPTRSTSEPRPPSKPRPRASRARAGRRPRRPRCPPMPSATA